jgi:hypothetical protein
VAQDRAGAGRKHGSHPPPLAREPLTADRIDTAMDGMEQAASHPLVDRAVAEPETEKLSSRHGVVLARRKRGDRSQGRFAGYIRAN